MINEIPSNSGLDVLQKESDIASFELVEEFNVLKKKTIELQEQSMVEPKFDSPHRSRWIVAVDELGNVSILVAPKIHPGFFDDGREPDVVGLPCRVTSLKAGVYEWICSYAEHTDRESGLVDGWSFDPTISTPLYVVGESS